jgi:hypothetical protein
MEAVLVGSKGFPRGILEDDRQYVIDLGLLRKGPGGEYRPANPIYQEVILRALTSDLQTGLEAALPDGVGEK